MACNCRGKRTGVFYQPKVKIIPKPYTEQDRIEDEIRRKMDERDN